MINNDVILKELMDWFDETYPGVHNEVRHSKCLRDTGYNLKAILKDLEDGGVSETCKVSKKYWQGAASQLGKGEIEYAVAINNKLGEILKQLVPEEQMEKVDRLINNMNDVITFGASSDLIDAMNFRENIRFFKQDDYPTKEEIEQLLQDAHDLVPQKNNIVECNIKVYGPEYAEEKKRLVLNTVCGVGKKDFRKGGKYEGDWKELQGIYDIWRKQNITSEPEEFKKMKTGVVYKNYADVNVKIDKDGSILVKKGDEKGVQFGLPGLNVRGMAFNEQVRAPYVLVYTQRLRRPSLHQKANMFPDWIYNFTKNDDDSLNWYISAAMHGVSTAYLAADRGISASFCKCFHWDNKNPKENNPKMIEVARTSPKNIAFMLCLGYRLEKGIYPKYKNYSKKDEYVTWA